MGLVVFLLIFFLVIIEIVLICVLFSFNIMDEMKGGLVDIEWCLVNVDKIVFFI